MTSAFWIPMVSWLNPAAAVRRVLSFMGGTMSKAAGRAASFAKSYTSFLGGIDTHRSPTALTDNMPNEGTAYSWVDRIRHPYFVIDIHVPDGMQHVNVEDPFTYDTPGGNAKQHMLNAVPEMARRLLAHSQNGRMNVKAQLGVVYLSYKVDDGEVGERGKTGELKIIPLEPDEAEAALREMVDALVTKMEEEKGDGEGSSHCFMGLVKITVTYQAVPRQEGGQFIELPDAFASRTSNYFNIDNREYGPNRCFPQSLSAWWALRQNGMKITAAFQALHRKRRVSQWFDPDSPDYTMLNDPERRPRYGHPFDLTGIPSPTPVVGLGRKFEALNPGYGLTILGCPQDAQSSQDIFTIYGARNDVAPENVIWLLCLGLPGIPGYGDCGHFCVIIHPDKIRSMKDRHVDIKRFPCRHCLTMCFVDDLERHQSVCRDVNAARCDMVLPSLQENGRPGRVEYGKRPGLTSPFALVGALDYEFSTTDVMRATVGSFAFIEQDLVVYGNGSKDLSPPRPVGWHQVIRAPDETELAFRVAFLKELYRQVDAHRTKWYLDEQKYPKPALSVDEEAEFQRQVRENECHICHGAEGPFKAGHRKKQAVRDHDHTTNVFKGAAHAWCNLCSHSKTTVHAAVVAHYGNKSDFLILVRTMIDMVDELEEVEVAFKSDNPGDGLDLTTLKRFRINLRVLARSPRDFITLTWRGVTYINLAAFLNQALGALSSSLESYPVTESFLRPRLEAIHGQGAPEVDEALSMLGGKLDMSCHSFFKDYSHFEHEGMPPIEAWGLRPFSEEEKRDAIDAKRTLGSPPLRMSEEERAKIWKFASFFGCKTAWDVYGLYCLLDSTMALDVKVNLRGIVMRSDGVDSFRFVGQASMAKCIAYRRNRRRGIKGPEYITTLKMYEDARQMILGAASFWRNNVREANNKYMGPFYDPSKESSFIMDMDASSLYLSYAGFMGPVPYEDYTSTTDPVVIEGYLDHVRRNAASGKKERANEHDKYGYMFRCDYHFPLEAITPALLQFPPCLQRRTVTDEELTPHQLKMRKDRNGTPDTTPKLIAHVGPVLDGYQGRPNWISSVRLQGLIERGCVVDKVYEAYRLGLKPFMQDVIKDLYLGRLQAAREGNHALERFYKEVLAALWGSHMMDKSSHLDYSVGGWDHVERASMRDNYSGCEPLGDIVDGVVHPMSQYAMCTRKQTITLDVPLFVGVWILEGTKSYIQRVTWEFCDAYPPGDVELCGSDTDSIIAWVRTEDFFADLHKTTPEMVQWRSRLDLSSYADLPDGHPGKDLAVHPQTEYFRSLPKSDPRRCIAEQGTTQCFPGNMKDVMTVPKKKKGEAQKGPVYIRETDGLKSKEYGEQLVTTRASGEQVVSSGVTKAKGSQLKHYFIKRPFAQVLRDVHETGKDAPTLTTDQIYVSPKHPLQLRMKTMEKKTFNPLDTKWQQLPDGTKIPHGWEKLKAGL